ncbi:MAG TPA: glycosyltransferase family 4 protein [Syntrophorhabdaceae bacterium]|nr:glycosyltransferase family 4 protein [Syntrophorhabdaceae bacterium]
MKKILFFTHDIFTPENPEGYRIHQYFPYLKKCRYEIELLTTRTSFKNVLGSAKSADVVYLQRTLLNAFKFSMLRRCARILVYDFDDAVMYGTKGESNTRRSRFARTVKHADAVFCGNDFLCNEAKRYKKDNVFYVPTVVDPDEYPTKLHVDKMQCVVGWTGSSSTSRYLEDIEELFRFYENDGHTVFKFIADKPPSLNMREGKLLFEKWQKEREKTCFLDFDMGIMPVRDDKWSQGKCGLKLIQYMAAGLPSITNPIGVANDMIEDGINGFIRMGTEGWRDAIDRLSKDVKQRISMGRAARGVVEERFSLKRWGPKISEIISSL